MSNPQGPIRTGWSLLWLLVGGCIVLWFLVHLIEKIWPWLLAGLIVTTLIWALVQWRRSRDRL